MPAWEEQPVHSFKESCCEGAATNANSRSARPCGCDPGANHLCEQHNPDQTQHIRPKSFGEIVHQNVCGKESPDIRNEAFHNLLKQLGVLHDKKNHDYSDAANGNYYSNFESAATVAGCSTDTVFRVMIGIKLARLDELLKGKTPLHESLTDSLIDLTCYAALWTSYRQKV